MEDAYLPLSFLPGHNALQLLPHKHIGRLRNQLGCVLEEGEQVLPLFQHSCSLLFRCYCLCGILSCEGIVAGVFWESGADCQGV